MAVLRFNQQQKERLIEMYNDPTILSKDLAEHIEKEMGFVLPYEQIKYIYNDLLGLPLRKRARKEKIQIVFEEEEEDIPLIPLNVNEQEQEEQENW